MSLVYNKKGDIVEIVIRDTTGSKIETFKFNVADKKLGSSILKYLQDKYGFSPEVKPFKEVQDENKDFWLNGGGLKW